jgi:predicted permease
VLLPLIAFVVILFWRPNPLIGFLIIAQAAMPSATSLSLIARHYQVKEGMINQGILFSHLVSIITIPLFLFLFSICSASF